MNRHLVISDIHGMYREMVSLFSSVGFDPAKDTLTVLGDYIDRGDRSREVVEYFMDLKSRYGSSITLLLGNHEDLCLKAHRDEWGLGSRAGTIWLSNGGFETLKSYEGTIPPAALAFMESLLLFTETDKYIFVHAGVHPDLPPGECNPQDMLWSRSPKPHYSGKMIVSGHSVCDTVTYNGQANTLCIDTGACKGAIGGHGKLSLVDLTSGIYYWVETGKGAKVECMHNILKLYAEGS